VKWRYSQKYGLLRVYWRTSSDATSYRVRLTRMRLIVVRDGGKTKKHFTPRPAPWVDTSVKRYRIEGVKPGARYAVSVRGVNSAGTGPVANARFTAE
jgi:hypothetical protein